ncbi:hypothetical protein D5R81_05700 [Parashewanella spongiae]|uniref:Uncharacterized protein n=1 Tax=Parashewanella spongiae TaxID=342950 RepID=A0A3A6UA17_9GAMM|nr:hypothetical protein [Parashewanella spongiae]MCL1077422.1 hypothetical protein [Parashewanella spongiae]RJY18361.1 hypothetical protein D5R81_05700 [Parashewanella spongiae]
MYTQMISNQCHQQSWWRATQQTLLSLSFCVLLLLCVPQSVASQNNRSQEPHGSSFVVDHANLTQHRKYSNHFDRRSHQHRNKHSHRPHDGFRNRYNHWAPHDWWQGKFWKNNFWHNHYRHHYRQRHHHSRLNDFTNTLLTVPLVLGAEQLWQEQRDDNAQYQDQQMEPQVTQVTTSMSYAKGVRRLPNNARVVQVDGKTRYQWQGKTYRFDWQQQVYLPINETAQAK